MLLAKKHDEYVTEVVKHLEKVGHEPDLFFHFEKLCGNTHSSGAIEAASMPAKAVKRREYIETVVKERQDMAQDPAIQKVP